MTIIWNNPSSPKRANDGTGRRRDRERYPRTYDGRIYPDNPQQNIGVWSLMRRRRRAEREKIRIDALVGHAFQSLAMTK